MSGKYDSILRHGRRFSPKHPPVPNYERAAQFAPFSPLNGFEDAVDETARLTDSRIELADGRIDELDRRLRLLAEHVTDTPEISVTYFRPDCRKAGGAYLTVTGSLKKIDMYVRTLVFTDRTSIPIDSIIRLDGPVFALWGRAAGYTG